MKICIYEPSNVKFIEEKLKKTMPNFILKRINDLSEILNEQCDFIATSKLFADLVRDYIDKNSLSIPILEIPIIPKKKEKTKERKYFSPIRKNIAEILKEKGPLHAYAIYKEYINRFGKISLRLLYYHLYKGAEKGIFIVNKEVEENGNYSWGSRARKVYYSLNED